MQQHNLSTLKSRISLVLRRFHHQPLDLYAYSDGHMDLLRRSKIFSKGINYDSSISSLHTHIFSNRFIRASAVVAVFLLVLLTSAILAPLYSKADITEATTGTAKESSLSFNLTNSTATVDLSVNKANGAFNSSTTPVSFNISTTNYSGYTLSIKGSNSTRQLVNSTNSSYTLSSISSTTSSNDFSEDSTSAGDNYNGKWGYLPSKLNSSTNTSYLPAPTTSATTLDKTSSANSSGTVNSYTIGIGARASYTTPAGEYTGTYILTAVGNPINYTVTYNKNTTDTVSSLPVNVSSSTSQTYITLSNNTPSREGYTFLGWCLGTITTNSNVDTCTGITYQPGNSFYIDQESANLPTLLAIWEKNKVYMQNLASSACTTTASEVVDSRDGTTYTIQRLADGNCWLLDNLALDLTNPTVQANLTSTTTNASDEALGYLVNGGGTSPYPAIAVSSAWTSASQNSYDLPYIAKSGTCTNVTYCVNDTGDGQWTGVANTITANDGADTYPGKVGIYYNFCAASAGSYCYAGSEGKGNSNYDICPSGWRMPTGSTKGEYYALYHTYSGSDYAIFRSSAQIPLSGYMHYGLAYYQGFAGDFWSSTYGNGNAMYNLYITASSASLASTAHRSLGYSVRCILRSSSANIADATYLQNVTSDMAYNMAIGETVSLRDSRDSTYYTIGKLADGRLWMLDNLSLDVTNSTITNQLTATNTNATDTELGYLKNGGGTVSDRFAISKSTTWATGTGNADYSIPLSQASLKNTASTLDWADGKYGVYYNFCAASAGSYCYGEGLNNPGSPSGNATSDICPSNWRLPAGYTNGEFQALYDMYSSIDDFYAAFRPAAAGYYNGKFYNGNNSGYYWSSTYVNSYHMGELLLDAGSVRPATIQIRNTGISMRCIFNG